MHGKLEASHGNNPTDNSRYQEWPPAIWLLYEMFFAHDQTTPPLFYPTSTLVFLPWFLVGPLAIVAPTVFLFVWNLGLFNGDAKTPRRTYILLTVTTLLNALWLVGGWRGGMAVQGPRYNFSMLGINAVWMTRLWFILVRSWKTEASFKANLFLHWLMFFWFASYAFPFFGEMT
ncbi:MAG: hypothetical protein DMG39_03035 [Acidobacteria bacterium]|nr:MAG: hypothetical protein DMG39_03035 [Acidobacteriota bacterium]